MTHVKNEDEEFDLILQDNAEKALEIDELEQQRDDLLSALESAEEYLRECANSPIFAAGLRAAIAKVKP